MHVHIAFEEAIKAACVDDATLTKMFGDTKDNLIKANASGKHVAMSFVIARPFIEHRMMSAVLAVAGTDTGATLFGPAGAHWRLSGPCTHFPRSRPSHPASRLRSQTCRSRRTRRSRRSRGAFLHLFSHIRCPAPRYVRLLTKQPLPLQALHVHSYISNLRNTHPHIHMLLSQCNLARFFFGLGMGSLPWRHLSILYSIGREKTRRNPLARKSVLFRGNLPKIFSCKSAFCPASPRIDKLMF